MNWKVIFHEQFLSEFSELPLEAQDKLIAHARLLEKYGATLSRPYVDTLKGSKYSNMKELRFNTTDAVWRVAFAFDPKRQAVLLVAGDKSRINQKRFYSKLISLADKRFKNYLE
ncbi:MAG: type II toxin-antitoxin system RelE/ParE family toxin, partial [Xenococcus sp. (in: cyanobacteria)]